MTLRVLFVCLGNICRSPAAEAALRALRADLEIDSAGTGDWHLGDAPYPPMRTAARARGLDLDALRARQVAPGDFARFDLIVAMDEENRAALEAVRPAGSRVPVRLLTEFGPEGSPPGVPDPYFTRDFEGALDLIEACCAGLAGRLP